MVIVRVGFSPKFARTSKEPGRTAISGAPSLKSMPETLGGTLTFRGSESRYKAGFLATKV